MVFSNTYLKYTVKDSPESKSSLYGLSALVLIPLAVVAIFLWRRKRSQPKAPDKAIQSQGPSEGGPVSGNEFGTSLPSAPVESQPMSVPLTDKYQEAGTHTMEQQGQRVALDGQNQIGETLGNHSYQPTVKDQCRTVVRPNGEVPIVSAVQVEPEPPKRKPLEP